MGTLVLITDAMKAINFALSQRWMDVLENGKNCTINFKERKSKSSTPPKKIGLSPQVPHFRYIINLIDFVLFCFEMCSLYVLLAALEFVI